MGSPAKLETTSAGILRSQNERAMREGEMYVVYAALVSCTLASFPNGLMSLVRSLRLSFEVSSLLLEVLLVRRSAV